MDSFNRKKESNTSVSEEISQSLKKQKNLMLDKSAITINTKKADPLKYLHKVDTFMLKRGNQSSWKKVLIPNKLNFDLNNPYLEFFLKPDVSKTNSLLGMSRTYEKLIKGNNSSCKEESKQAPPLSIFKIQPDILPASLLNEEKNGASPNADNAKTGQKNPQEAIYLMKSTDENKDSKERKYEDGVFDSATSEESDANRKKMLFTTEERLKRNPYYEFILRSEESNPDIYTNGNSEKYDANNLASVIKEKMVEKCKKSIDNIGDIFGNHFTSKDRNKFKVICPHCSKKVPAPGFVRHLTYCMKVGIRKRTRRF